MIVWIASYPKSGNTWVRMFLSAYLGDGTVDINKPRFCIGDLQHYFYHTVSPKPLTELTMTEQVFLRPASLMHLTTAIIQKPVFVKTHHANVTADGIPLIQPEYTQRGVYVVRDPRDVAVSYSHHFGVSIPKAIKALGSDTNVVGDPLYHVVASWSTHVKSWATEDKFSVGVMRYEDIAKDPVKRFGRMLGFLEIDRLDDHLERSVNACRFSALKKQERKKGFEENPSKSDFFRVGRPGGWKDVLTDKQEKKIKRDHGEMMERFGYV